MFMLSHTVYFLLKDRSAPAAAALVAGCRTHLTGHPGTLWFAVGTCSEYDRHVNDRDYDVALEIVFDSHQSHDNYQTADRHNLFIAEHSPTWARVRVFDTDLVDFHSQAVAGSSKECTP